MCRTTAEELNVRAATDAQPQAVFVFTELRDFRSLRLGAS
jgi:hypothetical protein